MTPAALARLRSLSTEARVGIGIASVLLCLGCLAWGFVRQQAEREREREREAARFDAERQEREWLAEQERAAAVERRKREAAAAVEREREQKTRLERQREAQERAAQERAEREAQEHAHRQAEERARAAEERAREELRAQEAVAGPRPKFSPWDASVYCVVKHLERYAHDPDSLDFSEWSPLVVQERNGVTCWAVRAVYRGKNAFGALIRKESIFYVRNEQVVDVVER